MTSNNSKVISIGNIVLGGTGKTPMTVKIAQKYLDDNRRVCILSRGYKGRLEKVTGKKNIVLSDGSTINYSPPEAPDEAYLIADNCKGAVVITGKDRRASYKIGREEYNSEIFILDDGFQHRAMERDVDVVLLDYANPFSWGFLFPFGYLRELPSALKRRGDVFVFTNSDKDVIPERAKPYVQDKPHFFAFVKPLWVSIGGNREGVSILNGLRCYLFSGIASNKRFFNMVESLGADIVHAKAHLDHCSYSLAYLLEVVGKADALGVDIILTTEKDFVKIPDEIKEKFSYLKIELFLDREGEFFNVLDDF